jgi:hypothetical protein
VQTTHVYRFGMGAFIWGAIKALLFLIVSRAVFEALHQLGYYPELWVAGLLVTAAHVDPDAALWIGSGVLALALWSAQFWWSSLRQIRGEVVAPLAGKPIRDLSLVDAVQFVAFGDWKERDWYKADKGRDVGLILTALHRAAARSAKPRATAVCRSGADNREDSPLLFSNPNIGLTIASMTSPCLATRQTAFVQNALGAGLSFPASTTV